MSRKRMGFVSNSSSSSFIVIGGGPTNIPEVSGNELNVPGQFGGETEFGWGPATHTDLGSRINFAYLQTEYSEEHREMLEDVLKDSFEVSEITWEVDGYIDHASSAVEGENMEIFDSVDELTRFLFSADSEIEEDNDNH